jgi:hypothetical protein
MDFGTIRSIPTIVPHAPLSISEHWNVMASSALSPQSQAGSPSADMRFLQHFFEGLPLQNIGYTGSRSHGSQSLMPIILEFGRYFVCITFLLTTLPAQFALDLLSADAVGYDPKRRSSSSMMSAYEYDPDLSDLERCAESMSRRL